MDELAPRLASPAGESLGVNENMSEDEGGTG